MVLAPVGLTLYYMRREKQYAAEQGEVGERRTNNPLHESDDSATVEVET